MFTGEQVAIVPHRGDPKAQVCAEGMLINPLTNFTISLPLCPVALGVVAVILGIVIGLVVFSL